MGMHTSADLSIRYMHPTRGDLEVKHYGRRNLEAFATSNSKSLPFILFVDGFGIHRNMCRSFKGFYLTPASLDRSKRRKPANEFTWTLGPHGASMADIVRDLQPGMEALSTGAVLDIGGVQTLVKAFPIVLTGDMPECADMAGFMRHNAAKGCRACFIDSNDRRNLQFDVISFGRFHFDTIFKRDKGHCILQPRARAKYFKDLGMRDEVPDILPLAPALDLILGRGYDAPHSEWRGIGRVVFGLLLNNILTHNGRLEFVRAMQSFPFPHQWPRIQSPLHLFSWSLSETGRALVLLPLILRCCSKATWISIGFSQSMSRRIDSPQFPGLHHCTTPTDGLVTLLKGIATAITYLGCRWDEHMPLEDAQSRVLHSRACYMMLIDCAEGVELQVDSASVMKVETMRMKMTLEGPFLAWRRLQKITQ
jgi:hypothetical protein